MICDIFVAHNARIIHTNVRIKSTTRLADAWIRTELRPAKTASSKSCEREHPTNAIVQIKAMYTVVASRTRRDLRREISSAVDRMPHCSRSSAPGDVARSTRGILDFSIFFLPLLRSPDPRTIMNTRCGTWIHLGSRVAAIQPPHQFLRARALVRYACTATPAPITDMETTFPIRRLRFPYIPGPARKIIRRPAARVNSDEKSRRSIRAGSRLEDRSVSRIREPGTFDSTPLFARVAGQRIFLTP